MRRVLYLARALRRERRPGRFVLARLLVKTGACRLLRIRCDEYRMVFFPTAMSSALWVDGEDRREDVSFFRAYLRTGDTVIDVGANVGFLSLLAATAVGPSGNVHAIEAHPRTVAFLRQNLALNGFSNVEIHETAVGASGGEVLVTNSPLDDQNYVSNLTAGGVTVPMSTLDALFGSTTATIDLLKIDVEGYELQVLQGGADLLSRTQCVYVESSDAQYARYGTTPGEVIRLLERTGFSLFRRVEQRLEQVGVEHSSPVHENLIAARQPLVMAGRLARGGITVASR